MSYHEDWLMRQIEAMVEAILTVLFRTKKDAVKEEMRTLTEMMANGQICKAEDLLWEEIDADDPKWLEVAVKFYRALNQLSDEVLLAQNFSRAEIKEGLERVCHMYGIDLG